MLHSHCVCSLFAVTCDLYLAAIWRVIRTLLNEAQQKAVIFVKGDEIFSYIDRDQLLKTMGGTVGVATVYWGKGNESVVPK